MPELVPVEHDPFAPPAKNEPTLVPVDHDPFAMTHEQKYESLPPLVRNGLAHVAGIGNNIPGLEQLAAAGEAAGALFDDRSIIDTYSAAREQQEDLQRISEEKNPLSYGAGNNFLETGAGMAALGSIPGSSAAGAGLLRFLGKGAAGTAKTAGKAATWPLRNPLKTALTDQILGGHATKSFLDFIGQK